MISSQHFEVLKLIAKFQFIEASIKVALTLNTRKQNENINSIDEFDDLPYGILLKKYNPICQNQALFLRLKILKDYRNYIAHKSLLTLSNMPARMNELLSVHAELPFDVEELNVELDECIILLSQLHAN